MGRAPARVSSLPGFSTAADVLAEAFEALPVAAALLDAEGRVLSANARWVELRGEADDTQPDSLLAETARAVATRELEEGRFEYDLQREGGLESYRVHVRRTGDGRLVATLEDCSADKQQLLALRESEQRYRDIVEFAIEGLVIHRDGVILDANEGFRRLLGYDRHEVLGTNLLDYMTETSRERTLASFREGRDEPHELEMIRRDGHLVVVEGVGRPTRYGGLPARISVARDVTARRHAEQEVRASEEKFRTLAETSPVAITIARGQTIHYANPAAARLLGYTEAELVGKPFGQYVHPAERQQIVERAAARQRGEDVSSRYETRLIHKSGRTLWVDFQVALTEFEGAPSIMGVFTDVTYRRRMEAELRESAMKLIMLSEQLPAVLWMTDAALVITDIMGQGLVALGRSASEMVGTSIADWGQMVLDNHLKALAGEAVSYDLEVRGVIWSAHLQPLRDDQGQISGVIGVALDVTEHQRTREQLDEAEKTQKQLQQQLLHADRLAAIGQLAAGIAHEINNPAAYVLANVEAMQGHVETIAEGLESVRQLAASETDPARRASLEQAVANPAVLDALRDAREIVRDNVEGIDRIRSIVRDLRTFARIEEGDVDWLDLNEVVDSACKLTMNEIRHRARLVKDYGELPTLAGDAGKLAQVFVNLLVNAAHAIGDTPDGVKEIRVSSEAIGEEVVVSIADTGPGVPEELRARVFEPFFTTKERDVGTGLGLSLCQEIVRKHGGSIVLGSNQPHGAVFEVHLPRQTPFQPRTRPRLKTPVDHAELAPRVLVVDDEPLVLRAYRRALRDCCDVRTTTSAVEAAKWLERGEPFDVVVCDVMMPDLDGPALFARAVEQRPELERRFVFCSGGATTPRHREWIDATNRPVLDKPVGGAQLEAAIFSVVAEAES